MRACSLWKMFVRICLRRRLFARIAPVSPAGTVAAAAAVSLFLLWICCLPRDLFEGVPYSTVVTDRRGELLGARTADDGQWRFPPADTLPEKFVRALVEFEDRTFYRHNGVSVRALCRALWQNIRSGRVVSGGSTLSMQVIRLSRRRPRTLGQKVVEMFMATRLEWRCSKREILNLYASHAPFGGNVVGIDAARWRYLGSDRAELSWAEAATLAVLQNAPSLIHLDRNRDALLAKRNRLLRRLAETGALSADDLALALDEPLIGRPYAMPQQALHWVELHDRTAHGKRTRTSLDLRLQQQVAQTLARWSAELRRSGARDLAAVVVEVSSGEVAAYCGNSDMAFEREGRWVDIARAPRSSGSILKPLLYAAALQEGTILPHTLLRDVPTDFGGFAPKNFDGKFAGAVPADRALALSLNVPNVQLLREFGVARFASALRAAGISTLGRPAESYGLSLILGGAEVTLADVVGCYARMAACYADTTRYPDFPLRDRVALYRTFEAMREVDRADGIDWRRAQSVQHVAWKTGTSYGSRDGWAVGLTPDYVVGVWVGNADGSSVAGLTGARTAGPVLFDLFALLPHSGWFRAPDASEGVLMPVCRHSGHPAGRCCDERELQLSPRAAAQCAACPYCREVRLSPDGRRCVAGRSEPSRMEHLFLLPPLEEHFYRPHHPEYRPLPPAAAPTADGVAATDAAAESMRFIYPSEGSVISLPRQLDGTSSDLVCEVAHADPSTELFWHLDDVYVGSTRDLHRMTLRPSAGYHTLTVVDAVGRRLGVHVIIL